MLIISGATKFQINERAAVVFGKFDGVHLGHRFLLAKLLEQKAQGRKAVVFTFDKFPAHLLGATEADLKELCTPSEKRAVFEALGVDVLVEFPMNLDTIQMPAEVFLKGIIKKQCNCEVLIVGEDVKFGHKGLGDAAMLKAYEKELSYQADIYPKLTMGGDIVSSTLVRKKIKEGRMDTAQQLLGHTFEVSGTVAHGLKLAGDTFQMPTANVFWPEQKVVPKFGVYFTKVKAGDSTYKAITNVGIKPTIATPDTKAILAESYLYDFTGDLYGKEITIFFYAFWRSEQKFGSITELKTQLYLDEIAGKKYWNE